MSRQHLGVFGAVTGLFAWLFADTLFGSGMFVFRDAAHFYYPLFEFIADEWAAGRVPLWNPYENLGMPLAGNPAASVFYPGKLVFAPPIAYPWAYKTYIMAHLLLAAYAAYRLARHWRASVEAAGVCALSYAFSGNVLFTYCNVVFLVGAAWLPLAMLAADRMLAGGSQGSGVRGQGSGVRGQGRRVRWAVGFGVVLALMVLGGDPQMAYNAGLLAVMYALWLWLYESPLSLWQRVKQAVGCVERTTTTQGDRGQRPLGDLPVRCTHPAHLLRSRPALLALAAATGLALSAVQVLPSAEFVAHSGRAAECTAAGLILGRSKPGTHGEHRYHFSVGPWRLAEYLWPNFGGRQFPVHRRWLEVIPAEGRVWTPSLYMGLLPLLWALSAMRLRGGRRRGRSPRCCEPTDSPGHLAELRDRWLGWSVVLAVLASFGWYGLGWLAQEIHTAAGGAAAAAWPVGAPFGGLYWLMTLILPGYAYFRYPAKLLVVGALGLSVLAARGFDRVFAGPSDRFRRGLVWLGGASLCGAVGALAVGPFWGGWFSQVEPDPLFGPLDTNGAANDLLGAFVQTAVWCGLFWWLLGRRGRTGAVGNRPVFTPARWVPIVALLLVAADLAVANRWLVVCAPAEPWQRQSKLAGLLEREERERGQAPCLPPARGRGVAPGRGPTAPTCSINTGPIKPYRVFRCPGWIPPPRAPQGPAGRPSEATGRLADAMRWDRDTLWPKYNLADRIPLVEVYGAMMPYDYRVFLSVGRSRRAGFSAKTGSVPSLLAKYAILPGDEVLPEGEPIDVGMKHVSLWYNPRHLPRAWIAGQVETLRPLESKDPSDVRRRTEGVLYPNRRPRDFRRSAVVEFRVGPGPGPPSPEASLGPRTAQARPISVGSCRVVHYDPLRVEVEAELGRPGLVVLGDQFYPGWKLHVETEGEPGGSATILRANRVMRGAWLPAGRHRLTYRYRPAGFLWGAVISGLGWIGLIGWGGAGAVAAAKRHVAGVRPAEDRRPKNSPP